MGKTIRLKNGYDINIKGKAPKTSVSHLASSLYALKPTDFRGIAPIPKMLLEIGNDVKAGDPIFYDKKNPERVYSTPVSGELVEIRRGPKRRIDEVVILADKEQRYKTFQPLSLDKANAEDIKKLLVESGAWHFIRQRPYLVTADPESIPKAIFISGFNSAPLSPDAEMIVRGMEEKFQAGITALSRFAEVNLSIEEGTHIEAYNNLKSATIHSFSGPHPAGNVGVQIHHINPIKKDQHVWVVNLQDVIAIGRLVTDGIYLPERVITVAGPEFENSTYYRTIQGFCVDAIDKIPKQNRIISGDVLTGTQISINGFLGFYDTQITIVPEGDQFEFFGWLAPSYPRPTRSMSLPANYFAKKPFAVNTNIHGERRAFVMSGEYERVLPMDIYPVQLLKAILSNDFDLMEGLGIYEVEEEDFALCEFVCTSKQPVQQILRKGIELIREQG